MPSVCIHIQPAHIWCVLAVCLFSSGCSGHSSQEQAHARRLAQVALSTVDMHGQGPVYVALRADGLRLAEQWAEGPDWESAATEAIRTAYADLKPEDAGRVNLLEINFTHDWREVGTLPDNIERGIQGIECSANGCILRYASTDMIARNLSFPRARDIFMAEQGVADKSAVHMRLFDARQALVFLKLEPHSIALFRGNTLVLPEAITRASVQALADGMGSWLVNQVQKDGRMTYLYWPSRGEESQGNNMIRQFMATWCLERLAAARNDPELHALAKRNLAYNLAHFYREENGLGFIEFGNEAKLGAAALAALAIVDSPERAAFAAQETGLRRLVDSLWNSDGSFKTFHKPAGRNDNQNFYPGEALLLWAVLYEREGAPELLERSMQSFRYYRDWHRAQLNPAFVPWHTQAYYRLWRKTQNSELRDFIFEMNDWLLDMQEWGEAAYPDIRGRFYNPRHPEYGPPHASSTGVYLEGLADACTLAREIGDSKRFEAYRTAILRGFRSAMQLQYTDEADLFYVSKRKPVLGGLRSTEYDNAIRVDNVQHMLMAVLSALDKYPEPSFYTLPPESGCGVIQR